MNKSKIVLVFLVIFLLTVMTSCTTNHDNTVQVNISDADSNCPWELGERSPDQYSLSEFKALSDSQKEMFFEWFESDEAFDKWFSIAEYEETYGELPWNHGGKKPDEYTWNEFQKLSDSQQEMFFEWFDNEESFDSWMSNTNKSK